MTVARSGADCQMDGGKEGDAKRRTGRDSEKDDAAARVDPSKVKTEKLSDADGRGVPKRRAEEGIQLTAAVAASQKGAVWPTRRFALARRNRVMPTQKVIPTQTVVIILSLPPEEQEVL